MTLGPRARSFINRGAWAVVQKHATGEIAHILEYLDTVQLRLGRVLVAFGCNKFDICSHCAKEKAHREYL
jgi:hypothetical protein